MAAEKTRTLVKTGQLHLGLELIGMKTTVHHREADIEATPLGLLMISKKNGRRILIPWTNIKGCELLNEDGSDPGKKKALDGAFNGPIPPKNRV